MDTHDTKDDHIDSDVAQFLAQLPDEQRSALVEALRDENTFLAGGADDVAAILNDVGPGSTSR